LGLRRRSQKGRDKPQATGNKRLAEQIRKILGKALREQISGSQDEVTWVGIAGIRILSRSRRAERLHMRGSSTVSHRQKCAKTPTYVDFGSLGCWGILVELNLYTSDRCALRA
jgi:hypothetical protein